MDVGVLAVGLVIGLVLGAVVGWRLAAGRAAAARAATPELRRQLDTARGDFEALREKLDAERTSRVRAETQLEEVGRNLEEQRKLLDEAKARLTDTFKALSADALKGSNEAFLELAKKTFDAVLTDAKGDLGKRQEAIEGVVKPLKESLKAYEDHVRELEKGRKEAYGGLQEQLKALSATHQRLEKEAHSLTSALRNPQKSGAWGEMTLRRTVELAGLSEHCDFTEQFSVSTEDGLLRPDLVVHLPGGREIVVDAKAPLEAYMNSVAAETEPERQRCLAEHARKVRDHMNGLSRKAYWEKVAGSADFVVMFIPGEPFLGAAVAHDPTLLEDGMKNRIVLATPTTLVALLRAVAYGWRQEALARNAEQISELGRDLYDRLRVLAEHLVAIGSSLEKANQAYNQAVGSMERRVFPAARRFRELGVQAPQDIPAVGPVETTPRKLTAPGPDADEGPPP